MLMFSQGKLHLRWPKSLENLKGTIIASVIISPRPTSWDLYDVWGECENLFLTVLLLASIILCESFEGHSNHVFTVLFAVYLQPIPVPVAAPRQQSKASSCRTLKRGVGQENVLGQSGLLLSTAVTTLYYLRNFNLFDSTAWQDFIRISAIIICKTQFHWTL